MFKSKSSPSPSPAAPPIGPALRSHLAKMSAIDRKRRVMGERMGALQREIIAAERLGDEIKALEQNMDAQRVGAVARGDAPPDLSAEQSTLNGLYARFTASQERVRLAAPAQEQLHKESEALLAERKPLPLALNHLIVADQLEQLGAWAARLDAALEVFYRDVWLPMWEPAFLVDQVSAQNHLGVFVDSLRFVKFLPQLPRHPAIDAVAAKWHDRVLEDHKRMHQKAEALLGRILASSGDSDA